MSRLSKVIPYYRITYIQTDRHTYRKMPLKQLRRRFAGGNKLCILNTVHRV